MPKWSGGTTQDSPFTAASDAAADIIVLQSDVANLTAHRVRTISGSVSGTAGALSAGLTGANPTVNLGISVPAGSLVLGVSVKYQELFVIPGATDAQLEQILVGTTDLTPTGAANDVILNGAGGAVAVDETVAFSPMLSTNGAVSVVLSTDGNFDNSTNGSIIVDVYYVNPDPT